MLEWFLYGLVTGLALSWLVRIISKRKEGYHGND
jgi:tetrahydromethanopterin S-methyltransferase subunit G